MWILYHILIIILPECVEQDQLGVGVQWEDVKDIRYRSIKEYEYRKDQPELQCLLA
jgi:hypothetical protein